MGATVHSVLRKAVESHPHKVFLIDDQKEITFQEMYDISERLASSFLRNGLGYDDRIALLAPNQIEWLITFYAASKIGASIVPLNVRYREYEFRYMLNHSKAKAIVSVSDFSGFNFLEFFQSFQSEIPTVEKYFFIGCGFHDLLRDQPDIRVKQLKNQVKPDDTILMIYTSGTTGKPKGAMITHQSILASAKAQAEHFLITEKDVAIGALPLNHVGGITCTVMVALISRSQVILIPTFIPKTVLESIGRFKATIVGGVPTMYYMLLNEMKSRPFDLHTLRLCIVGGSSVDKELVRQIASHFPSAKTVNLYGLSETSGACVLSKLTDSVEKVGASIGVPIGDFQMKVVDGRKADLPFEKPGELAVKGACVAKGYYGRLEETKESFSPDGWLYTGDIVTMDEQQYIYFHGRKKEMYVQGGFNIFPAEIEEWLIKHPKVLMAAGIGIPDQFLGEIGIYYIVPKQGEAVSAEELELYCSQFLADYKLPKKFFIVDNLPVTSSGKIQKEKLKELFMKANS